MVTMGMLRIGMVGMVAAASCAMALPGGGSGSGGGEEGPWDRDSAAGALVGALPAEGVAYGFVVSNGRLWYVADDGDAEAEAVDVGGVKVMYTTPVWWGPDGSATLFSDDPSASPTGAPVSVSVASSAVVMEVVGPWYQGYVVGMLSVAFFESEGLSGEVEVFDGWALAADFTHGKELADGLSRVPGEDPDPIYPEHDCARGCMNEYADEMLAAKQRMLTCSIQQCSERDGFLAAVGGCGVGAGLCIGTPPPLMLLCCLGSATATWASYTLMCIGHCMEVLKNDEDAIRRRYIRCLQACGIAVYEI